MLFARPCSLCVLALAACTASTAPDDPASAVIRRLDLTSFANATGPRRQAGLTTFADYGFTQVERTSDGAILTTADGGWMMAFRILPGGSDTMRLCLRDKGLAAPGDVAAPTYDATSALLVEKGAGQWTARQVEGGFPSCRNEAR